MPELKGDNLLLPLSRIDLQQCAEKLLYMRQRHRNTMSQSNSMDLWELANVMSIVFLKHIKKREEGVVAWQLKDIPLSLTT